MFSVNHATRRLSGLRAEQRAARFLKQQGLQILTRNFSCRLGEIDLIARDADNCLVFVEVRYRQSRQYGGALASVTASKQARLRRAAGYFITSKPGVTSLACRFDVIAFESPEPASKPEITWIRNAFY